MMDQPIVGGAPLQAGARSAWWAIVLRGILAVVFGILVLASPGVGAAWLIVVFAAYAAIDGVFALATAVSHGRAGSPWGWWVVEGLVSLAVAALALARPGITLLAIVLLIAFRAIALGIVEVGGAVAGRGLDHRWLLGITGTISILFGIFLIVQPFAGALALVWAVGVYAVVFGVMLVGVGLRLLGASRHPPVDTGTPDLGGRRYAT
jgi:uncharacterized membrane protein HdeD (DUF308 family)